MKRMSLLLVYISSMAHSHSNSQCSLHVSTLFANDLSACTASFHNLSVFGTINIPGIITAGCQLGPLTIGTSNATPLNLATNGCSNTRLSIDPVGNVTVTDGDLTVNGDLILPQSGSSGLIQLGGGDSASATNVRIYEHGNRNLFAGNGTVNTTVTGSDNIRIGTGTGSSLTTQNNTIAIGNGAAASNANAVAIGNSTQAIAANSIAIGDNAIANNSSDIAIGNDAEASNNEAIAIGFNAVASAPEAIAIGKFVNASDDNTVAIGANITANNNNGIAIGHSIIASGNNAIAIGNSTSATTDNGVAIGNNVTANNSNAVAIGVNSNASSNGVALGSGAGASGGSAIAMGFDAAVIGDNAIAIGANTFAGATEAIVIGLNAVTSQASAIILGNTGSSLVRVGIGDNTPNAKLHVASNEATTPVAILDARDISGTSIDRAPQLLNLVSAAAVENLQINGATGQLFRPTSSKRFKENFRELSNELAAKIYALHPLIFDYKKEHGGAQNIIGFTAEEIAELFPSIVNYDDDGTPRSIKYDCLHALTIKALQQLKKEHEQEICKLQEELHEQSVLIQKLLTAITQLEKKIQN